MYIMLRSQGQGGSTVTDKHYQELLQKLANIEIRLQVLSKALYGVDAMELPDGLLRELDSVVGLAQEMRKANAKLEEIEYQVSRLNKQKQ
jgi:hypothetical protein